MLQYHSEHTEKWKKKNYVCVNKDENNSKKSKRSNRKKNMKYTLLLQYEKRIFDWILTNMAEMEEKSVSKV